MKKRSVNLMILLFIFCFLAGCCSRGSASPAKKQPDTKQSSMRVLTIGTADSGGTMSPVGKAIAKLISDSDSHISVNTSVSNGSSDNIRALEKGEIDLGLVSGDMALAAVTGTDEFLDAPWENLRAIAAVYSSVSGWIAPSSLGISYVHDLRGMRIGIGPQDSTTELSARIVLDVMGIDDTNTTINSCGLGSGGEKIKNKSLSAVHAFAGLPVHGFGELAESIPCTILKYTEDELLSILSENTSYYPETIPAGTYRGQTEDIPSFGIKCILCVSAEMDDDLVYELTGILYQGIPELKEMHGALSSIEESGFLCSGLPIRLHPGAEQFYREHGLLTENES